MTPSDTGGVYAEPCPAVSVLRTPEGDGWGIAVVHGERCCLVEWLDDGSLSCSQVTKGQHPTLAIPAGTPS